MSLPLKHTRRLLTHGTAALACAFTGASAHASSTSATACGNVWNYDCDSQSGASSFASQAGPGPYGRTFRAMAEASSGALKASVGATSDDAGGQDARATATFVDDLHFNLPAGMSEFKVTLNIELHGDCTGVGYPFSCAVQMGLTAGRGLNNIVLNLQQPGRASGTLTLRVGDDLPLDSFLDLRCHASYGHCAADYSHTGMVTLSPLPAGVSVYSDSGHNYVPVPEPNQAWLWLTGLAAGGALARRHHPQGGHGRTSSAASGRRSKSGVMS